MQHHDQQSPRFSHTKSIDTSHSEWFESLRVVTAFAAKADPEWSAALIDYPALMLVGAPNIVDISGTVFQEIENHNRNLNLFLRKNNVASGSFKVMPFKLYFLMAKGYSREDFSICLCRDIFQTQRYVLILHSSIGDLILDDIQDELSLWFDSPYYLLAIEKNNSATGWAMMFPSQGNAEALPPSYHKKKRPGVGKTRNSKG